MPGSDDADLVRKFLADDGNAASAIYLRLTLAVVEAQRERGLTLSGQERQTVVSWAMRSVLRDAVLTKGPLDLDATLRRAAEVELAVAQEAAKLKIAEAGLEAWHTRRAVGVELSDVVRVVQGKANLVVFADKGDIVLHIQDRHVSGRIHAQNLFFDTTQLKAEP